MVGKNNLKWLMTMSISIRYALEKDLQEIVDIHNQAIRSKASTGFVHEFSVEGRKEWFLGHAKERYPLFVAEEDGKVVGWISISPYRIGRDAFKKTVEVDYYIHDDFKRKGIGNELLRHMLSKANDLGYRTICAILLDKNIASIRLLEKNGFKIWGLIPEAAELNGNLIGHVYYGKKI
ncbi:MAG TPA: N-acetyltransferase [Thermoplasmata archaeon]|jgi:L-amino acid N-acyltransferase YncA|nr:MAG TPA: N-acetyltransferase [Thermoplasmata archaeon]